MGLYMDLLGIRIADMKKSDPCKSSRGPRVIRNHCIETNSVNNAMMYIANVQYIKLRELQAGIRTVYENLITRVCIMFIFT